MLQLSSRQRAAIQVRPAIAELLRTCVHPPVLILQVEHVVKETIRNEGNLQDRATSHPATKFFLTDGQLLIQALLHRNLGTILNIRDVEKGDIVEIHDFVVKKARRRNGKGHVLYLGIENCYVIKLQGVETTDADTNTITDNTINMDLKQVSGIHNENNLNEDDESEAGGFVREDSAAHLEEDSTPKPVQPLQKDLSRMLGCLRSTTEYTGQSTSGAASKETSKAQKREMSGSHSDSDSSHDDNNDFETLQVNLASANKRRRVLHELSQNIRSSPSRPQTSDSIASRNSHPSRPSYLSRPPSADEKMTIPKPECETKRPVSAASNSTTPTTSKDKSPANRHSASPKTSIGATVAPAPHEFSSRPTTPLQSNSVIPFHPLSTLYSPSLPGKSYTFAALVVPTYVASHLISRPNSAFPPKRHIKVVDPSLLAKLQRTSQSTITSNTSILGKGITVSVYRDAANFRPTVGRVALLNGVVMQRLQSHNTTQNNPAGRSEVILNVYPCKSRIQRSSEGRMTSAGVQATNGGTTISGQPGRGDEDGYHQQHNIHNPVKELNESDWFTDDHDVLKKMGYDVDGMQQWWDSLVGSDKREESGVTKR